MKRILLPFVAILALGCTERERPVASAEASQSSPQPASEAVHPEDLAPAPDFERDLLSGGTYKLSESQGRVVVVNFWATWCGPCIRETPGFVSLQNEWADRPFEIVGVSLDEEGFEVIEPFAERYEVSYPMVVDDGTLADEFGGVYAMPSSFIIDKQGRIVHRVVGEFPFEELRPEMERLMAD